MTDLAAPTRRGRFSLEALEESRPALAAAGVALAVLVAAVVWAIVASFTGSFTDVVTVRAQLPPGSNAVQVSAPVEYLNVTVGKIGSETEAPNGAVAVNFQIYPKNLRLIPNGVEAQVAPLSIFGNQYVNLVPPAHATSTHLEAGDFVAPYTGAPSSSLQGTVTQLYDLLDAIHPSQLDTALTAFAEALNGQGQDLGQALSGSADYLGRAVVPNLPTLEADLALLGPVAGDVNQAAPALLGTLSNSATPAGTITQQSQNLKTALSSGASATRQFASILQQVQTSLPSMLNEAGPLLADVTQRPNELSETLTGLTTFAAAVASQEQAGPYLSVHVTLPVADISAGVNAALGYDNPASVEQALGSAVDPPTYTSANCPEYPGESNPYCATGGSPDATPSGGTVGAVRPLTAGSSGSAPSGAAASGGSTAGDQLVSAAGQDPAAAQYAAVQSIAAALNGGQPTSSPALATLVLLPLLSSMAGR